MSASIPSGNDAELRVLVVDDHADMLTMMNMMMQRRSYEVRTATSGLEAMELAPDFAPHVVVSDIGMPGMNGFQLLQNLRSSPELRPFKAIALTGYDVISEPELALESGFDAHVTKPIEFDQLFQIIENLADEMRSGE
jgi:two-component system CheB/CheR fusion protein